MSFEKFVREADQLIHFYAVTPPGQFLEHGSVFSNDITVARLTVALLLDLESLARKHGVEAPAGELSSDQLVAYASSVEDKFRKAYYDEGDEYI